ncbi:MAG TPA: hypothetical protein VHB73_07665 [Alphaproteobacteria bacterium]|nr:hypothetical protein [Alphaproteobacteria bacterium]
MSKDYEQMVDDLENETPPLNTNARLIMHERICGVRWKAILARMARIESVITWCAGGLIAGMAGLIITLALKH